MKITALVLFFVLGLFIMSCKEPLDPGETWQSLGLESREYAEAALAILTQNNSNSVVTIKNIFKDLGPPQELINATYYFDKEYNVLPEFPRLSAVYNTRDVFVNISAYGSVESITYTVHAGYRKGLYLPNSLQAPAAVYMTNKSSDSNDESRQRLLSEANIYAQKKNLESEWLHPMQVPFTAQLLEVFNHECDAKVMVADKFHGPYAYVVFSIVGKHSLFCDTWWEEVDGGWRRLEAIPDAWQGPPTGGGY